MKSLVAVRRGSCQSAERLEATSEAGFEWQRASLVTFIVGGMANFVAITLDVSAAHHVLHEIGKLS